MSGPPEAGERRAEGYTLGITIFVNKDGDPGIFENGLRQNVLFLYRLFSQAPGCRKVYLLNHGEGDLAPDRTLPGVDRRAVVGTPEVLDQLDAVIVAGAALDRATGQALRERGCVLINYKGGNGAVISMEAMIARPPRGDAERYFDWDLYDEIWLTPQHVKTYKGWCETVYRRPVIEVPQIWEPLTLESAPAEVRARFGFDPAARRWRIGVMDPNITVMKTSHLPMLVCEAAYRQVPEMFAAAYISNTIQFKDTAHFQSFAGALSITRAGVLTAEPRFVGVEFLANHCDAVVTHQWENGLNYLYYEALYGGYPLIHNSEFLKDFGYYYEAFDPAAGGKALLRAFLEHRSGLDAYRRANQPLFDALDPLSDRSIRTHAGRLQALLKGR